VKGAAEGSPSTTARGCSRGRGCNPPKTSRGAGGGGPAAHHAVVAVDPVRRRGLPARFVVSTAAPTALPPSPWPPGWAGGRAAAHHGVGGRELERVDHAQQLVKVAACRGVNGHMLCHGV
jgi:hypothetical protein